MLVVVLLLLWLLLLLLLLLFAWEPCPASMARRRLVPSPTPTQRGGGAGFKPAGVVQSATLLPSGRPPGIDHVLASGYDSLVLLLCLALRLRVSDLLVLLCAVFLWARGLHIPIPTTPLVLRSLSQSVIRASYFSTARD